jgi:hypothetical protein
MKLFVYLLGVAVIVIPSRAAITAVSDACSILQSILEELVDSEYPIFTGKIESGNGTTSFCNTNEYCEGLYRTSSSSRTVQLSCAVAFQLVTRYRFNRPIDSPPILSVRNNKWHEINGEMLQTYLSDSRDLMLVNPLAGIPEPLWHRFKEIEQQCLQLVQLTVNSFPRLVYREPVEGKMLSKFVNTARKIKHIVATDSAMLARVRQYLFSSLHIRTLGWHLSHMLQQIAYFDLKNAENIMISMSPILHAFFEFGYIMDLDYSTIVAGNEWIIAQLSTIHPLYDMSADVWNIPMPTRLSRMEIDIPLPVGYRMTWDQLKESVLDDEPLPTESLDGFLDIFVSCITQLNPRIKTFEQSMPVIRQDLELIRANAVAFNIETRSTRILLKRTLFTMRYLEEYEPRNNYPWRLNNNTRQSLSESSIQQIQIFIAYQRKCYWLINGDHPTIASLMYVFRDYLDLKSKLFQPHPRFHIHCSPLPKIDWDPETLDQYVENIMYLRKMDLMFVNQPTLPLVQFPRILSWFFYSSIMNDETEDEYHQACLRALGRTFALILKQPNGVASVLRPYLQPSSPGRNELNVFQTLFFRSFSIRLGFHDVFPYGHIERVFSNGGQLLDSIPAL